MSWEWNNATTTCRATITAYDSGSWTMAGKFYARSEGENSNGYMIAHSAGAVNGQRCTFNAATMELACRQNFATTSEVNTGSLTGPGRLQKQWFWFVGVYDESLAAGSRIDMWVGTEFATMTEVSDPSLTTAANGARTTALVTAGIGNIAASNTRTFDGYIEDALFDTTAWSKPQIDAWHEGWLPHGVTTMRYWLPFKEACNSTTQAPVDLGGGGLSWASVAIAQGPRAPRSGYRRRVSQSMQDARR